MQMTKQRQDEIVDRRIGGLEIYKHSSIHIGRVDRRIGGLEIVSAEIESNSEVDRRIGGLEMR